MPAVAEVVVMMHQEEEEILEALEVTLQVMAVTTRRILHR